MDAGSTGSRIYIYEWEPREFKVLPPPVSHPKTKRDWKKETEPGISSYCSHPEVGLGARAHARGCVQASAGVTGPTLEVIAWVGSPLHAVPAVARHAVVSCDQYL